VFVEPTRWETRQLTLLGFGFFGDPFQISGGWTEENEIGRLWSRFMAYLTQNQERLPPSTANDVCYELHVEHPETMQTGEFEVFVGFEVEALADVPVEMMVKILPQATYAVFCLEGAKISADWSQEILEWMIEAGYERAYPYGLQRYDERFKGLDRIDESILEVYVPLVARDA